MTSHLLPLSMPWSIPSNSNFVAHSERTHAFFGRRAPDASDSLQQDRDGASGMVAPAPDFSTVQPFPGTALLSSPADSGGNEWLATSDLQTQSSIDGLSTHHWYTPTTAHTDAVPQPDHHQSYPPVATYRAVTFQNQTYPYLPYQQTHHHHIYPQADSEENNNNNIDDDAFSLTSPSTYYPSSPASDSTFAVPSPTIDQISSYSTLSPVLEHYLSHRTYPSPQSAEESHAPHHQQQHLSLRDPSWLTLQQQQPLEPLAQATTTTTTTITDASQFQPQQQHAGLLSPQDNVRQRFERYASSSAIDSSSVPPPYHQHPHSHPHGHTTPTRRSSGPYERPSPSSPSSPSSMHPTASSSATATPQQTRRRRGTGRAPREVAKKPPPPMACLFCRGRKIACSAPPPDAPDRTCDQCERRGQTCEYPLTSRRGQRKQPSAAAVAVTSGIPSDLAIAGLVIEASSSPETA